MKETIEAWCVVYGSSRSIWNTESDARQQALLVNGTVVKLTGEVPRKPIERKTVAYVKWMESPASGHEHHLFRLGIMDLARCKDKRCQHKVEIIVREVQE